MSCQSMYVIVRYGKVTTGLQHSNSVYHRFSVVVGCYDAFHDIDGSADIYVGLAGMLLMCLLNWIYATRHPPSSGLSSSAPVQMIPLS